jgi:hypothetical protein
MAAGEHERRRFLWALKSTEAWLQEHFAAPGQRPAISRLASALRQYLRQSRRAALSGRTDSAELDRRLKKIESNCAILWEARVREGRARDTE